MTGEGNVESSAKMVHRVNRIARDCGDRVPSFEMIWFRDIDIVNCRLYLLVGAYAQVVPAMLYYCDWRSSLDFANIIPNVDATAKRKAGEIIPFSLVKRKMECKVKDMLWSDVRVAERASMCPDKVNVGHAG